VIKKKKKRLDLLTYIMCKAVHILVCRPVLRIVCDRIVKV